MSNKLSSFRSRIAAKNGGWHLVIVAVLCGVLLILSVSTPSPIVRKPGAFLTTQSPSKTYTVELEGNPGRAFVLPKTVTFSVLKQGQPFIESAYLHSVDSAFDLSFEVGYPDHRWLSENALEFFLKADYEKKSPDKLFIENRRSESIRYLRIQTHNKVLIFDLEPRKTTIIDIPPPRGDFQSIGVEGLISESASIEFTRTRFKTSTAKGDYFKYYLSIDEQGIKIKSPGLKRMDAH